jgi:Holliday junction resolvase
MGKASKRKGNRIETEIVNLHRELGIDAARVPLSGSAGGEFSGDIRVAGLTAEVKARKDGAGFSVIERWLADRDILFLRRDRAMPLAVLPWRVYARMIAAFTKEHGGE